MQEGGLTFTPIDMAAGSMSSARGPSPGRRPPFRVGGPGSAVGSELQEKSAKSALMVGWCVRARVYVCACVTTVCVCACVTTVCVCVCVCWGAVGFGLLTAGPWVSHGHRAAGESRSERADGRLVVGLVHLGACMRARA